MFAILDADRRQVASAETVTAARRLVDHHFRTDLAHAPFHYVPEDRLVRLAIPSPSRVARLRAWLAAN